MSNIDLGAPIQSGYFRRLAIGAWGSPKDPKVYTKIKLDITHLEDLISNFHKPKISYVHFFIKVLGETFNRFPELNRVLVRNRLYQRQCVSAFVHVHLRAGHGYDLLGVTIKNCDKKSLKEISSELEQDVKRLRLGKNKPMENAKLILKKIPPFLYKSVIRFFDFLMYTLNIDCSFIGMPKDAYGSFAVSAIGSLGFEEAYLPLFPFSRLPLIMGIGKPYKKWCYDGKKQILKTFMVLTFTMDHRYYDGAHFAKPIRFFKKVVADPVKYGVFISK